MLERLRSPAVANVLALYGVQALGILVPLATFPFLVRTVGVPSFGIMNYALSWAQLGVVVTALGFNYTATRRVTSADSPEALEVVYSATMVLKLALALVSIGALIGVSFIDEMLGSARGVLLASCALVIGEAVFPSWMFMGMERMGMITKTLLVGRVLAAALLFLTVRSPSDEIIATLCQAVPQVIAGVIAIVYVRRSLGVRFRPWQPLGIYRESLRESMAAFSTSLPSHVYARGQFIVLGQFVSVAAMGHYAVAQRIVGIMATLAAPLSESIYPRVCRVVESGDWLALRRRVLSFSAPAAVLLTVGLWFSAPLLIRVIGGDDASESAPLLQWLSPLAGLILVSVMLRPFAMALQRYRPLLLASLAAAALFLILGLTLTPRMGAPGMVVTMVAVEGIVMVLVILVTRLR